MLNLLYKKLCQRGVAIIEYAILLAFVAVIAVSFIGAGGLAEPINYIVRSIDNILQSGEQTPTKPDSDEIILTSIEH